MSLKTVVIDLSDNVATATSDLAKGEVVKVSLKSDDREWVELSQPIPFGHKFALRNIAEGEYVLKYGEPIGRATTDIQCGEHVHTHNMRSLAGEGGGGDI
jgi:altronate dehydratase small subunit